MPPNRGFKRGIIFKNIVNVLLIIDFTFSFIKSLGISSGFTGCIEMVWLNSTTGNFTYDLSAAEQPFKMEEHEIGLSLLNM